MSAGRRLPSNRCPRLFTVTEVADQMKVSGRTVRRKISGGELHFHRLGRQIRVSEEDLLSYLNQRRR